ncbi:TRAP transporter substrate-binding protein [bacterium]|nr:TRAP transporter substrate-binding protein [bacterium]
MKNEMRKFYLNRISILFVGVVLAMMVFSQTLFAAGEVYKARLSYHWGPKHYSAIMTNKFAEEVGKATNGRLQIDVFPQGQLYNIQQVVPALAQGSVDMAGILSLMFLGADKNLNFLGMQNLFSSFQQMRDYLEKDPIGSKYWNNLQKKLGIKILAYVPVGPAAYFSTARPLDSVAAFKGLKARTLVGTEKYSFKPLGVNYVKVSTSEVYSALKSGMIDTVMTVPSAMKGQSWWDFFKYAQLPYQLYADAVIAVNLRWWESLPRDIQDIVQNQVGPMITEEATNGVMAFSKDILDEFVRDHNGTVSTLSKAEFQKLLDLERKEIYPAIGENMDPELYQSVMKYVGLN